MKIEIEVDCCLNCPFLDYFDINQHNPFSNTCIELFCKYNGNFIHKEKRNIIQDWCPFLKK